MECKCGVLAILLEVKKEGPNKGRLFYACKNRGCDFFEWKDQENRNTIHCDCRIPSIMFEVKKEGPNKGRKFFTCKNRNCQFFKWKDDIEN